MKFTDEQVQEMLYGSVYRRMQLAENGYKLGVLVHDLAWGVRLKVAKQGYGLDILVNDEDMVVRCAVAKQEYGLNILVHDDSWQVRSMVANQGYGLGMLMYDDAWQVRCEVAKHGYGLEVLMYDTDWDVRKEVVKHGYKLDILSRDSLPTVRKLAEKLLGAKRHLVASNFGTYEGDLVLYTWEDRYFILAGCYDTDSLPEWERKCEEQLDMETALRYTKIIQDIIKEEVK